MIIIIYIVGMVIIPFFAWLFLESIKDGGINEWYDRLVLFPLRERNSRWAKPLGECEMCFTIWLNTAFGTVVTGWWLWANGHDILMWIIPSYAFLNMGVSAMIYKLYKQLK